METVRITLRTPLTGFANDYCDVLKLFFTLEQFRVNLPEGETEPLVHTWQEENGLGRTSFSFRGETETMESPLPRLEGGSPEHWLTQFKRVKKRLTKNCLYQLLKRLTGHQPPWGSLTGIRPTRLFYEQLAQGRTPEEAERSLQETFDVTPEKTDLLSRIVREQQKLPSAGENWVDVYVSIPFCRTRCAYCSFPGEAVGKGALIPPYLRSLFREMEASRALMDHAGLKTRAVYVGGGTPSALCEEDFEALLSELVALWPEGVEYTVEAGRPDTITREKLESLRNHGIRRISINPQTMNDETLSIIGRNHSALQTEEAFLLARELGFEDINMDVIAGLPGETPAHFEHTMERILALAPDSLTVHTLAIKRSSRLNLERWPLPDGGGVAEMVRMGEDAARQLNMAPYYLYRQKYMAGQQQNVGYAVPGKACLYNVDIMEETTSILAMGAGAISKRVFPDRELRINRSPNVTNVREYTERVEEMIQRKNTLFMEGRL